ncbi:hypothetical protein CHU98_g7086 [Xylaria longipes]|nr:hypothetical protein CHU98_g7086 [Xylaria longipes]
MVPVVEPVQEAGELPPANVTVQRPPSLRSDTDDEPEVSPRDIDSISIDSTQSIPDFTGRKMITFDDERSTTAYEAWEWRNNHDGLILTSPIVSFDQGELADMHEDAIRGYKHKHGISQEKAYEQDLANRANDLPADAYDRIQQLIEDKTMTTNRNPYRQREWRVVVLQPGEFRMTELLPVKRKSFFSRKRLPPKTRTYFVVLRGKEVKSTKEDGGWKAFNRLSNPWWRLDNRETKEERDQHKDVMKKMDRARGRRCHHPRPRPRPVGPIPSSPAANSISRTGIKA